MTDRIADHTEESRETLDLRQYTSWCASHGLHLCAGKRADITCYARELEVRGRAQATIARRLCTVRGFYR